MQERKFEFKRGKKNCLRAKTYTSSALFRRKFLYLIKERYIITFRGRIAGWWNVDAGLARYCWKMTILLWTRKDSKIISIDILFYLGVLIVGFFIFLISTRLNFYELYIKIFCRCYSTNFIVVDDKTSCIIGKLCAILRKQTHNPYTGIYVLFLDLSVGNFPKRQFRLPTAIIAARMSSSCIPRRQLLHIIVSPRLNSMIWLIFSFNRHYFNSETWNCQ